MDSLKRAEEEYQQGKYTTQQPGESLTNLDAW